MAHHGAKFVGLKASRVAVKEMWLQKAESYPVWLVLSIGVGLATTYCTKLLTRHNDVTIVKSDEYNTAVPKTDYKKFITKDRTNYKRIFAPAEI